MCFKGFVGISSVRWLFAWLPTIIVELFRPFPWNDNWKSQKNNINMPLLLVPIFPMGIHFDSLYVLRFTWIYCYHYFTMELPFYSVSIQLLGPSMAIVCHFCGVFILSIQRFIEQNKTWIYGRKMCCSLLYLHTNFRLDFCHSFQWKSVSLLKCIIK